ncbi:TonB-dependent receptor [Sphingomonas sp. C3-2]|uniref:TonB-dependent receptor n=1 Tax=Sphingomonas sp. C3-2 TaxID=3062169 RepID=UPI00294AD68B|nr:TonB-dependent receptor [Sphingomonas sp. C3-2]WOK37083.1 TonB-dependent receptor [Sphingomonas sp. C3-2]
MKKRYLLATSTLALALSPPAAAQDTGTSDFGIADIVVTAQRQSERLQDVPISISAFSAETLEKQQIDNATDLQLTLPNVTFTKTNFTSSSFTIRGIGDLCVGFSCDQATGIHVNDMPLVSTRLFETEYFDLERVEVLRGPQGTLYGRNATSGVVNFITARPDLTEFHASGSFEYGNYDSYKINGMVNIPLGETLGLRVAGYYLNRDGYTKNEYDGSRIDGRDLYALRGTLRFEPSASTTIDLIGYYFREKDNRSRIQKQLCHRDPTGILGCQPDKLADEYVNANATLGVILSSREFLSIAGSPALAPFGLQSIYGTDLFAGQTLPSGNRNVRLDYNPTYFAEEIQAMAKIRQDLGDNFALTVTGGYAQNKVDSRTDYYLAAANNFTGAALPTFRAVLGNTPVGQALLDSNGNICVSDTTGAFGVGYGGGFIDSCGPASIEYDRSAAKVRQYSIEGHIDSRFDGPFNFLLGGIYLDSKTTNGTYQVAASGLDYGTAVLGGAASGGQYYVASPYFDVSDPLFRLKSYGVFGEVYFQASEKLKLTAGLRYSHDSKFSRARNILFNFPVPVGTTDIFGVPRAPGAYDADPSLPGDQLFRDARVKFSELTGRFVVDLKLTDDNLLYASYSRGYKSGGVNPPFNPVDFPNTPIGFKPEFINAFEIGTKNTLMNGTLRANFSAFYYDYKDLQLSRILNKTSFNDNTDATIYGVEAELLIQPDPAWLFNINASYLKSKIKNFSTIDTRDPSGGRSDTVIIKNLQGASNCVVIPGAGANGAAANAFVGAVNGALGLQGPVAVPGTNTTGAFSFCNVLAATAANPSPALLAAFGLQSGPLPFTVTDGVPVDLDGNELPQAPNIKVSVGGQYTHDLSNGMNLVARGDIAFTGDYFARSFNRPIDRIKSYSVINMSLQLNGTDDKWFVRGFVQNLTNNGAITGQYVTDASTGLFTNVFTLEPRRYGIAAGFKF